MYSGVTAAPFASLLLILSAAVLVQAPAHGFLVYNVFEQSSPEICDQRLVILSVGRGSLDINGRPIERTRVREVLQQIYSTRAEQLALVTVAREAEYGDLIAIIDDAHMALPSLRLAIMTVNERHYVCPSIRPHSWWRGDHQ